MKEELDMAKVYFTKDISAEGLKKAFHALGVTLKGNVGVKISTGEPGGHNFLHGRGQQARSRRVRGRRYI